MQTFLPPGRDRGTVLRSHVDAATREVASPNRRTAGLFRQIGGRGRGAGTEPTDVTFRFFEALTLAPDHKRTERVPAGNSRAETLKWRRGAASGGAEGTKDWERRSH